MAEHKHPWAPLVYGRTLNVDFRLLAIPQGLSQSDLQWARRHIRGATLYADDLREGHRWSLFKSDRYCAFGLTCMASLVSTQRVVVNNRELYLFAGYVSRIDRTAFPDPPHHPPVPPLPAIDRPPFSVFRTLYDYVDFLWQDERTAMDPDEIAEELEKPFRNVPQIERLFAPRYGRRRAAPAGPPQQLVLNYDPSRLRLYPLRPDQSPHQPAELWAEAAYSAEAVSLCLGLPERATALEGPYLNVSLRRAAEPETIEREPPHEGRPRSDEPPSLARRPKPIPPSSPAPSQPQTEYERQAVKFINAIRDIVDEAPPEEQDDWINYDEP